MDSTDHSSIASDSMVGIFDLQTILSLRAQCQQQHQPGKQLNNRSKACHQKQSLRGSTKRSLHMRFLDVELMGLELGEPSGNTVCTQESFWDSSDDDSLSFDSDLDDDSVTATPTPSERNVVIEAQPEFRAVAFSGKPAELRRSTLSHGSKFGSLPPLGKLGPESFKGKHGSLKRSSMVASTTKAEKHESVWMVASLDPLPLDFPLERTHREVHDAEASKIAERISQALQSLSIEAEYDDKQAKATCTTCDMVKFQIRMYSTGQESSSVLVELQRRSGSARGFVHICEKILNASEGSQVDESAKRTGKGWGKMLPFKKRPISGMKFLQSAQIKRCPASQAQEALAKSADLIRSAGQDAKLLGFENLCLLTDPIRTRPDISLQACKSVLLEKQSLAIREAIEKALREEQGQLDVFETTLTSKTYNQAIVFLSNVLVLMSQNHEALPNILQFEKSWVNGFAIPALVQVVGNYESLGANNAYEAARGLASLANISGVPKKSLERCGAREAIQAAHSHGRTHHEMLAEQTSKLMSTLGSDQ